MFKKVVATSIALATLTSASGVYADTYEEISCSTDSVFSEYSCNQCFDGGVKNEKSTVTGLSDLWVNKSTVGEVMYKEVNFDKDNLPKMHALGGSSWIENKVADSFWEATPELDKIYDSASEGYLLKAGESVNWIRSTEGSSYVLDKNTVQKGSNVGLLVYDIKVNKILENGEINTDQETHKECVLFKSGDKPEIPVNGTKKDRLPNTGPEHFILLLPLAMFLAFGVLRFKKG